MALEPMLVAADDAFSPSARFSLSSSSSSPFFSSRPPAGGVPGPAAALGMTVRGTPETPYASSDVPLGHHHHHHYGSPSHGSSSSSKPVPTGSSTATLPSKNTRSLTIAVVNPNPNHHPSPSLDSPPTQPAGLNHVRREPLPSSIDETDPRFSLASLPPPPPRPESRFLRSGSVDSPTLYEYPESVLDLPKGSLPSATGQSSNASATTNPGQKSLRNNPAANPAALQTATASPLSQLHVLSPDVDTGTAQSAQASPELASDSDDESVYSHNSNDNPAATPSMLAPKPTPLHLNLSKLEPALRPSPTLQPAARHLSKDSLNKPLPKSPLFGWTGEPSPTATEFSSIPSPISRQPTFDTDDTPVSASAFSSLSKDPKANASTVNPLAYCESHLHTPPPAVTPTPPPVQIEEMEEDFKVISAELAASIRREMDLEDLVDRLQADLNNQNVPGRRTSDYFSDSGISSAKFSEFDQSREEVEKIQRRADQEKAQIRLELTTKLQDERSKRKQLDQQLKELGEKASRIDLHRSNNADASGRVKELEAKCAQLTRKLSEERLAKGNVEDLLAGLKGELRSTVNERDNLRDEVVPQLRARVEGLEAEAVQHSRLTYDTTKMQQELQSLKDENSSLRQSSNGGGFKLQKAPAGLSRSNTTSKQPESKDGLAERLKDVEAQRDALHSALKSLLERQEFQNRENEKKIKALETERDRLLAASPQKAGYEKDLTNLRNEINVLRRRAEDAIEQKWRVEKGLAGLKMDLDRAEEEIGSLKKLLEEKDILIPATMPRSSAASLASMKVPVSSEAIKEAFQDLQASYRESLERIRKLELGLPSGTGSSEKIELAIQRLEQSLSTATSERDAARHEASSLRGQVESLTTSEAGHLASEKALAEELRESARRVEELAAQVQQQLAANSSLRQRLAEAVSRGDADRKAHTERITSLQGRLKTLEDKLATAQAASEERVARHEDQINALKEAHNHQLRRVSSSPAAGGLRTPQPKGLTSSASSGSLSPMPSPLFPHSPRRGSAIATAARSMEDEAQMATLRTRVSELEGALAEADSEMQNVVAKMSAAQIEVLNLQEEREAAVRESRRLLKMLEDEQPNAFRLWATSGAK